MRLLGFILVAGIALRLLQLAIVAGLIALALLILWGAFSRPQETFGLLFLGLLGALLQNYPLAFAGLMLGCWIAHLATRTGKLET